MIKVTMKASQCMQKSYRDKRRKDIEFQVGDHVFLRVNPVTGVGCAFKLVDSGRFMSFVHPLIWTATEVSRQLRLCGLGS